MNKILLLIFIALKNQYDDHFDHIEKWLGEFEEHEKVIKWHRIEQTLIVMLAAVYKKPWMHLPPEYDVAFSKDVSKNICKHYVGAIRFGFELEGVKYLLNEKDFVRRWNNFIHVNNNRTAS